MISLTLLLTLSACASDDTPAPAQSQAPSATAASSSQPPASSASPQASEDATAPSSKEPPVPGETISKEQIRAALDDFKARHKGALETPNEQFDPRHAEDASEGLNVKPEQCRTAYLGHEDVEIADRATTHPVLYRNTANQDVMWLSMLEYPTAEDAHTIMKMRDLDDTDCARMEIEAHGVKMVVTHKTRDLPHLEGAEMAHGVETVQTLPGGASTTTHSVVAWKGNLHVTSSLSSVEANYTAKDAEQVVLDALKAIDGA